MKSVFKKIAVTAIAAAASTCMAISVNAYAALGVGVSYKVSSTMNTWNNQQSDYAWDVNPSGDCVFSADVSGGTADFTLKRWLFYYDSSVVWPSGNHSGYFKDKIPGNMMEADDYFAEVKYVRGGTVEGKVYLSRA